MTDTNDFEYFPHEIVGDPPTDNPYEFPPLETAEPRVTNGDLLAAINLHNEKLTELNSLLAEITDAIGPLVEEFKNSPIAKMMGI